MTNTLRTTLALALTLTACESREGRDLCLDLAFAAPACEFPQDTCPWRTNADCDDASARLCVARAEDAYQRAGGVCTQEIRDIRATCGACIE